ncbi:mitochondrial nucleoid-associated protein 1 [Excalfactoria chinensis]|uniref:mitochondrial nucleoid-associated protein 1 n=1 Tax=Excalfactoria chinensis TaxID=46218 RepID=UPI003B3AE094
MAEAPPGTELCPHCRRPFKRLRSHLPHCKAAPGRETKGAERREGSAAEVRGEEAAMRKRRKQQAAAQPRVEVEAEARDVAQCLDLLPEEVAGVPEKLRDGVKVVIENHRARVLREGSSPRAGREREEGLKVLQTAGPEGRDAPKAAHLGVPDPRAPSSKGGKDTRLNAVETRGLRGAPEADGKRSRSDLAQQEGTDKALTEEKRVYVEAAVGSKAPLSVLHAQNLHLSPREDRRGHKEGTAKNDLTMQMLSVNKKQMAVVSEPVLNAGRDSRLDLDQSMLHTSKSQPICLPQASGRSTQSGAVGLEWFPDLHSNYHSLSVFPGKSFQEDVGIAMKTPKDSFSEGHRGPLSERHLMDVRLGELPMWLTTCDFSPRGLLGGVQKVWSSYYNKYINVKRGGAAGISMLLAGYCVLSYSWNYQHIKCNRWRKYH